MTKKTTKKHQCKECVHKDEIHFTTKEYTFHSITKPIKYWKHMRNYPFRFFMIMMTENGLIEMRYVYTEKNMFVFNDGVYMTHNKYYKWCDELQTNVGMYIEGISLPINFELDKNLLKEMVEKKLYGTNVQANVDAQILHKNVVSQVIEKVMQGGEMEKLFSNLKMIGLISAGVSILILLMLFWKLG